MIKKILRFSIGIIAFFIGIFHFVRTSEMAVYVPIPFGAVLFVQLVGIITVFASLGIIINKYLKLSLVTLAITMSFTALLVQIPIILREPDYILKVIGLSTLVKLGLAVVVLLSALFYRKSYVRSQ